MSTQHGEGAPSPDEFDRQLRDLYSGSSGVAKFREPSAAERAKRAAKRRREPGRQRRRPMSWQKSRQARKLRRPVTGAPASGNHATHRSWRRWLGPLGRLRSGPRRALSPADRRQRLRTLARRAGILVGFIALLFLLHMLGFGPQ